MVINMETTERERLYRAWDTINKKMLYDEFDIYEGDPVELNYFDGGDYIEKDWRTLKNLIVMDYINQLDINGNKIYGGDIIEEKHFRTRSIVVWYIHGWYTKNLDANVYFPLIDGDYEVVVGNIYENPELLGEDTHG